MNRRDFFRLGTGLLLSSRFRLTRTALAAIPGGSLDPADIPKYQLPLVIPPAMPRSGRIPQAGAKPIDYYEIAVRQFNQQILPPGLPQTTVWSYGSIRAPGTVAQGGSFNYPAFTIEAASNQPVRVKWMNQLIKPDGTFLPHLLPVDQTLHWANPPGGVAGRDGRGTDQAPYTGPVPMVTHVHGAHTRQESDGYPEAWFLPVANNIPAGFARTGTFYDPFKETSPLGGLWEPGTAVFQYPNDQRAMTSWYHDHVLGMTRLNVYAGPAGFYLIRGGPDDVVLDSRTGGRALLPGSGPGTPLDPVRSAYEIPIAIQDRSFNANGSLFYPDNRAFFEGLDPSQLQIPFIPDTACGAPSDVPPIWNPEFFGNVIVVNGRSWPFLQVEPQLYRLRLLNGCDSRFLVLKFNHPNVKVWQIGAEGGFLAAPVLTNDFPPDGVADGTAKLLIGPAERADVLVDFRNLSPGTSFELLNIGPDEPFGGFPVDPADPASTGKVMRFDVVPRGPMSLPANVFTEPNLLVLPAIPAIDPAAPRRPLSLNEEDSATVRVVEQNGDIVLDCEEGEPFGPVAALLGTHAAGTGMPTVRHWDAPVTENPALGATETWELYNFTADAHPIHVHLILFRVVNRQALAPLDEDGIAVPPAFPTGSPTPPEPWETGFKDSVIAYPGQVTRIQAKFDVPGLFVWHCHILEHEDNEMMRPYRVGP